jgi:hypothetical protein
MTPLLIMDDTMGLGTPNFFSAAWESEQNYGFGNGQQSTLAGFAIYPPQFHQGQAENNQLDYFTLSQDQFASTTFNPQYRLNNTSLNADLDKIFAPTAALEPQAFALPVPARSRIDGLAAFNDTIDMGAQASKWTSLSKLDSTKGSQQDTSSELRRGTEVRHGQITPANSTPEESKATPAKERRPSTKGNRPSLDEFNDGLKVKKPRKSKRKPLTKEQEEAKRKKFLERNRIAADKCRQNRKKWIDDLQNRVHLLNADNAAKKATVEHLEQEVVHLRLLLFIHSRACNQEDIVRWVEQEARRVELEAQARKLSDDRRSTLSQMGDEPLSPLSRGAGSISDAASRRFSAVTVDDAITSPFSSGRSSIAQ